MRLKLSIVTILISFLATNLSYAKEYYVFIEKKGPVNSDDGQSKIGEVLAISENTPNDNELKLFKVIIMDLTEDDIATLLMSDESGKKVSKIDIDSIKDIKNKEKISENKKNSIIGSLLPRDAAVVVP